ncbi:hypothetical protein MP638_001341 [Amoeboaphelidium occidentale]|nr:hypothetical protein MP638_001341 [Amoeboaphelidium occidentale]
MNSKITRGVPKVYVPSTSTIKPQRAPVRTVSDPHLKEPSPSTPEMAKGSKSLPSSTSTTPNSSLSKKTRKLRPKPVHLAGLQLGVPQKIVETAPALDISECVMKIDEKDVEKCEELGMGSGGIVYLVKHKPTKTWMAKKIILNVHESRRDNLQKELKLMNQCRCPQIVSFYGAQITEGDLHIYMEHMDVGSLEKICKLAGKLNEETLIKISVSILRGLGYLYDKHKVMHRDIKPSNVLLNSKGEIKICDFGESRETLDSVADTFVGTGYYMSPERIQGWKNYSYNADTWSLGLSILELGLGFYPFSHSNGKTCEMSPPLNEFELLSTIVHDKPHPLSASEYSADFIEFINQCLIKDHKKRPSPKELLTKSPIVEIEKHLKLDMAAWAKSFLEPNLSQQQLKRWSVTQEFKRQSFIDKRQSRPTPRSSLVASRPPPKPVTRVDGISDILKGLYDK